MSYDPESGIFTWLISPARNVSAGDVAGSNSHGYQKVVFEGRGYLLHRLAFLYMAGSMPEKDVDHINQNRSDNRWVNLREVTVSENGKNTKMSKNNTTSVSGVTRLKNENKYLARVMTEAGKRLTVYRGYSLHAAKIAMQVAYINHGYHRNHCNED